MEVLAIILFISLFLLILYGYPVAFTLGGLSVLYALCFFDPLILNALPMRIMGIMSNYVLLAVPLFVFMGIMLERSGIAEGLLESMGRVFGRLRGGLAISVILVGALLAASTGIVGATVVTMGLISLPTMLKRGYHPALATGTIATSGTLGQIIPPSVVLVLLGSVLNVPVGDLFAGALLPGLLLVGAYIGYILIAGVIDPSSAPPAAEPEDTRGSVLEFLGALLMPLLLIGSVLGSIFAGIASPTEAAAVGAAGATLMAAARKRLHGSLLKDVMRQTTRITSMVFLILIGATTFSFLFREMGGDIAITQLVESAELSPMVFLLLVMAVVFVAGFFIDFIEIVFIIVPVVAPIFMRLEMNLIWIGVLLAINLQTSFLTPPFGFALFYLKGVSPPEVTTGHLYKGVLPFIGIQLIFLVLIALYPNLVLWLVAD
jgi:tripartite ATP-independent transporter DctM subunit